MDTTKNRGVITVTIALALGIAATGCPSGSGSPGPRGPAARPSPDDQRFARLSGALFEAYVAARPVWAAKIGRHDQDGKLPDLSPAGVQGEIKRLEAAEGKLSSFDAQRLSERHRVERAVLLSTVRRDLFHLKDLNVAARQPMIYPRLIDLTTYLRPYKPDVARAKSLIAIAEQAQLFLEQAQVNLQPRLPRTWIRIATLMTLGRIRFLAKIPAAFPGLDATTTGRLKKALASLGAALRAFAGVLATRRAQATDDFALGPEKFKKLLATSELVTIDLPTLKRVGTADLERNYRAIVAAAKKLDPKSPAHAVIMKAMTHNFTFEQLVARATAQSTRMRKFLIERKIASIPSPDKAEVRETPPFLRFNPAFLRTPGPFTKKALRSYYYLSPANPKWPKAKQQAYLSHPADLLYITIHELWPGHFLDYLHRKANPSRILKAFGSYARVEGWAHYTEEMMLQQGVGKNDPTHQIGQLRNALLRNVRYLCAIGLHTEKMTVAQCAKLFKQKAFQDDANAREQAVRGTFDPGYLNYTLGKLMIKKLRRDYQQKLGPAFTLQKFHDRFLSCCGAAPVPVIRRTLLGKGTVFENSKTPRTSGGLL